MMEIIFRVWKENKCQPRILDPEKQTIKYKNKSLSNSFRNVKYLGTNKEDVQGLYAKGKLKMF